MTEVDSILQTVKLEATSEKGKACQQSVIRAAELLKAGELVAFPTDTVYGLAAVASQPGAVTRLYVAKERPAEKAIPILIADVNDLTAVVTTIGASVARLIAHFWPGGLTLILPKSSAVPPEVSSTPNVAVRLPAMPLVRQVIRAVGTPLAVTSANRSGQPSPRTAGEVMTQLGGRIAAILDGGTCPGGVPSTILDCTTNPPRILRAGAVSVESLHKVTTVV